METRVSTFEGPLLRATSASYRTINRGQQPGKRWQGAPWTTVLRRANKDKGISFFFFFWGTGLHRNIISMSMHDKSECLCITVVPIIDQQKVTDFYKKKRLWDSKTWKHQESDSGVFLCRVILKEQDKIKEYWISNSCKTTKQDSLFLKTITLQLQAPWHLPRTPSPVLSEIHFNIALLKVRSTIIFFLKLDLYGILHKRQVPCTAAPRRLRSPPLS